jgi:peptidoglycan hydrolase-like protein with peptidoglycan-binding domain
MLVLPVFAAKAEAEDSTFVLTHSSDAYYGVEEPDQAEALFNIQQAPHYPYTSNPPGDDMVALTQMWLNQEYGDVPGFSLVTVDGISGTNTLNGLLRALQHELGMTELLNVFGPTTSLLYSANPLHRQDGVTDKKFAILQGALWCKGYNPGGHLIQKSNGTVVFNGVFDAGVEGAVIQVKTDAGFNNPDGVVTLNLMKALLTMESFKLISSGKAEVRVIQQEFNRKYEAYMEQLVPCDGVYGRATSVALAYALQAEEGLPIGTANGNFGNTTKLCCPQIPYDNEAPTAARSYPGTSAGALYTEEKITAFTRLLQFALYVNGFTNVTIDGVFSASTQQALGEFQQQYALPVTQIADIGTWMALFSSSGDTSRAATACDCATILTPAKAQTLYSNGYRVVGRYLTGTYNGGISKALTVDEAHIIFDAGLSFFPIYQTSANTYSYFTEAKGTADAEAAIAAAFALGLPRDTIIYFAVDFDATDPQITNGVIPYFKKVSEKMSASVYKTGIYGVRNVCSRVSALGYTCSSFVGDMSNGFSGNLGYALPKDWAFDQFSTISLGAGEGLIEIDKDAYSGRDQGVSYLYGNVRFSGNNRVETANSIAAQGWPQGAETVILASGRNFADALAAAPLAAYYNNAPILLTSGSEALEENVVTTITTALKAKKVIIVGGESSVSKPIYNQLSSLSLNPERLAGGNRYGTAIEIAKHLQAKGLSFTEVFLADGTNFPDALSVSPVAGILKQPILFTNKGDAAKVNADTGTYIKESGVKTVNIVGGGITEGVISNLKTAYGVTSTKRLSGGNRYTTATAINSEYKSIFTSGQITVTSGANFPDALAGSAYAAKIGAPLFLLQNNNILEDVKAAIRGIDIDIIYIFGGESSLSDKTISDNM